MTSTPGYIIDSLIKILDYDRNWLSKDGLKVAVMFKVIQETEQLHLDQATKALDEMMENR